MFIRLYSDLDRQHWDDYVEKHPQGTFYHKIGWKNIIESSFGHKTFYLICEESNNICGLLPLVQLKSILFGNILCSMPFLNFGGVLFNSPEAEKMLIIEAERIAEIEKADYVELRHLEKSGQGLQYSTHKISMTIKLLKNPDVLWKNFSSKHRNELRKALKNELDFRVGKTDLLNEFYRIISEGWRDLGTPIYQKKFFRNILDEFTENTEIVVVMHNKLPIAAAFNGYFNKTVEGMWTYALPRYRHLRTNYFLYWKMIERACLQGFATYHLGRSSKDSSSVMFKNKWNAEPKQLFWEYILNKRDEIPKLNVDNPKYKFLIKSWQKLPVRFTQFLGPYIAKYIP